ncbi:hypothetical protein F7R20_18220 [Pseudomonas brassicacearum subsp. brassicacearum]|nr:hypothetical protein F7R20_18220 [Pseudomonas brassicacearum subsp. brassicacearum]PJH87585.1 hypothetical protein CVG87_17485 [Pseudomonas sp. WCS365]QEO79379.1 hypothetical protein ELZ14_18110 [Pseudomonas brassicacearum]
MGVSRKVLWRLVGPQSRASSLPQGCSVRHKTSVGASLLAMAACQAQRISSCQGYTPSSTAEQNPYIISHNLYELLPRIQKCPDIVGASQRSRQNSSIRRNNSTASYHSNPD